MLSRRDEERGREVGDELIGFLDVSSDVVSQDGHLEGLGRGYLPKTVFLNMGDILNDRWIFAGISFKVPRGELAEKLAHIRPYAERVGGQVFSSEGDKDDGCCDASIGILVSPKGHVGMSPLEFLDRKAKMEELGVELSESLGNPEYLTRREFFNLYPHSKKRHEYCFTHSKGLFHYSYTVADRKAFEDEHPDKASQIFPTRLGEELKDIFGKMEEHLAGREPGERKEYAGRISHMRRHLRNLSVGFD